MSQSGNFTNQQLSLLVILSTIFLLACFSSSVNARYLPTRSDESRRERIKEVLRVLLDIPQNEDVSSALRAMEYQPQSERMVKREAIMLPSHHQLVK